MPHPAVILYKFVSSILAESLLLAIFHQAKVTQVNTFWWYSGLEVFSQVITTVVSSILIGCSHICSYSNASECRANTP